MIPRFIVRNITPSTIMVLETMGYSCREMPVPEDVLLINNSILYAPMAAKNPLIVNFDESKTNGNGVIIEQAKLHLQWQKELIAGKFATVKLNPQTTITVTKFGVLIDSFVVRIADFKQLSHVASGKLIAIPKIASHMPVPATDGKLTIGCANYTIDDFNIIMKAYNSLLT